MNTYITNLFNNGNNEGDITILTSDEEVKCHSFILKYCTDFQLKDATYFSFKEYDSKTMKYLLNYIYNQTIQETELSCDDIINLFNLSEILSCKDYIKTLKNVLADKFYSQLTQDNWLCYYNQLYGDDNYAELQQVTINYYLYILNEMTELDADFMYGYQTIKPIAVYELLTTALKVLADKNIKLQNMVEKETESENGTDNEEDMETDDEEEETETDTYSVNKITELLKSDFSFKQIANMCKKDKELVINDFVKHVRKNEKGKSLSNVITKYNIIYKNDKASLEKILLPQKKIVCL